jgi:tripartite-type tricarboxylate transporter receptor subunit TctC
MPLPVPAFAQAKYPNRPVTLVCPWGAGGGTDATARIVAAILEKDLGQPFNVINRTGGSGVVGHPAIATAAPDGYTIGMITVEITMMHHQGLTDLNSTSYSPLALMNVDPPGVQVNATSPYKDVKALADAIKAAPAGKFKASGTGQGGIWHLALIGWLQATGLKPDHVAWVPSNGAAPAMQDLAAGGIDIVTCSVPEAKAMIDAGKAKSLAVMAAQRNRAFKDVPTRNEALGINYSVGAWRGIAAPKGIPALVFGIPGDSITAIVIGVLYMKGMNPGPTVFLQNPQFIYAVFIIVILANLLMLPLGYAAIRGARKLLTVPKNILMPIILLFCVVGSFAMTNSPYGILLMLIFGVIGWLMEENGIPVAPLVLGLVLGELLEQSFMTSMIKSDGAFLVFFQRPIAGILGAVTLAIWAMMLWRAFQRRTPAKA